MKQTADYQRLNLATLKQMFHAQGLEPLSDEAMQLILSYYISENANPADYDLENWVEEKISHESELDDYLGEGSACYLLSNGFYVLNRDLYARKY